MTLIGAIGRLQPDGSRLPRIRAGLARLEADPSAVLVPVDVGYPADCVDGRPFDIPDLPSAARSRDRGRMPRVAGGTLTTWLVDVLLTGMFLPTRTPGRGAGPTDVAADMDPQRLGQAIATWAPSWLSLTCASLRDSGRPVSAHSDDLAATGNCGCGAVDSLATILGLLGQRPAGIVSLMESWGADPADVPVSVLRRCGDLALTMPDGDDIAGVIAGYADAPMPVMHGGHGEIAIVANTVRGTTVDPAAAGAVLLAAASPTGPDEGVPPSARGAGDGEGRDAAERTGRAALPQIFVVDVWALDAIADFACEQSGRTGWPLAVARDEVVATAAAFNAATLLTLCGPQMPSAVLRP